MRDSKKVLICAAGANELSGLWGKNFKAQTGKTMQLTPDVDVLITGVGAFQTAYNLTNALSAKSYSLVMGAGIAGEYCTEQPLTKIYVVDKTTFTDCGFESEDGSFASIIGSAFLPKDEYPFSEGYIFNNKAGEIARLLNADLATANTVNSIKTDKCHISKLLEKYPANIETMESGVMSYVTKMKNVNYCEIRCTSNYTLPKNESKWLFRESTAKLAEILITIIKENCKNIHAILE